MFGLILVFLILTGAAASILEGKTIISGRPRADIILTVVVGVALHALSLAGLALFLSIDSKRSDVEKTLAVIVVVWLFVVIGYAILDRGEHDHAGIRR